MFGIPLTTLRNWSIVLAMVFLVVMGYGSGFFADHLGGQSRLEMDIERGFENIKDSGWNGAKNWEGR